MIKAIAFALTSLVTIGCGAIESAPPEHGSSPDAGTAGPDALVDAAPIADGGVPTCNGYEPCGVNPVVVPSGYTLENGVHYDDYGVYGTCTAFEDCGMWDTHFSKNWLDAPGGQPVDPYYNRMGSPFPWTNSRYEIDVLPNKIMYATLRMTSPGELYVFSDGTPETRTARTTGATTCFQRGSGHMDSALLENLGGTGDYGAVTWNISILPGDMGNSGNASSCSGKSNTTWIQLTSDPVKAATTLDGKGKPIFCLLREGETYYINFQSSSLPRVDCSTTTCTMGGFAIENFVGTDGSQLPTVEVPCS